jgi:putative PIN family toxin of toxin-antitoxin system
VLRVVADTNVYVSALAFGGVADEVLALARARQVHLFISSPILNEIEGVLHRKLGWSAARAREATVAVRRFTEFVRPRQTVAIMTEDEPDNRILECALEAGAQVIVTGDKHLRAMGTFEGSALISPRELLEGLGRR